MRIRAQIALVLVAAAAAACGPRGSSAPVVAPAPAPEPQPGSALVVEVTTARVTRGAIQPRISAPGSLLARRESRIGAEVRGRIQEVFIEEGDRVEAGDPLFQIARKLFEVALRQAEAGLDLARAERRQIQADLERLGALHSKAIVAADELDRMRTNVAVAKARERQASESVAMAQHNLEQTLVTAPFGGSIAARLVDEGTTALVQPQTIVVVLQETAELEAEANIPESQLAVVQVGDPALVHVEGLEEPIETEVVSVGDTIDVATRTYRVHMRIPNADHRLKAGVFARIDILPRAQREMMLVPHEAVRRWEGSTRVLVVRDGRVEAVPVRLGIVSDTHAEVLGGLEADQEVIVGESAHEIAPGMQVRVVAAEPSPAS